MESDDDICILNYSDEHHDIDVDAASYPITPFSPLSRSSASDIDHGSHHALQKAYTDLKHRLNETNAKNQQLTRRVKQLEAAKTTEAEVFVSIGPSFDMMDDAKYVAHNSPTLQYGGEAQLGAEEGFNNNLQRQLAMTRAQLQAMERTFQETVQEADRKTNLLNQQVALLNQEKLSLQQSCEMERRERETALRSLQETQERCNNLQIEKEKAVKEGATLQASLRKMQQELETLKEKQVEGGANEPPPQLVEELAHMRRVIDKLKTMVLLQKDCLVTRSMSMSSRPSLSRSPRDLTNTENDPSPLSSNRSGGSPSGQSWELVNNGLPSSIESSRQQPPLQQRCAKTDASPRPNLSLSPAKLGVNMNSQNSSVNGVGGGDAGLIKTVMIQRRKSEEDVPASKNKTEVVRAHTLPQTQTPQLSQWMRTHYQHHPGSPFQPSPAGLNQLMQDATKAGGQGGMQTGGQGGLQTGVVAGSKSGMVAVSKPGVIPEASHRPVPQPRPQQFAGQHFPAQVPSPRQTSPVTEPASVYDNFSQLSSATTVPSMHILNQSSMTGARVLQNDTASFGSGSRSNTPSNQQSAQGNRDVVVIRGSSQDVARPPNPTDLQLNQNQEIRFVNEHNANQSRSHRDHKCPVCGQDFSHISMDEFQTHVFECFDDADDSSTAPETMQPQRPVTTEEQAGRTNRVCPMCARVFAEDCSQNFFEGHVQSHFEDVPDHFEVLDVHRT